MPNLTPSRQQARAGILARSAIVNDEELLGFVGVGLKAFGVYRAYVLALQLRFRWSSIF